MEWRHTDSKHLFHAKLRATDSFSPDKTLEFNNERTQNSTRDNLSLRYCFPTLVSHCGFCLINLSFIHIQMKVYYSIRQNTLTTHIGSITSHETLKQRVNKIYFWRATHLSRRCDFRLLLYQYLREGTSWLASYYHTLILHTWCWTSFRLPQSFSDLESQLKKPLRPHTSTPLQQCSFTLLSRYTPFKPCVLFSDPLH